MLTYHQIDFSGGMNSDDDDKSIPRGDYRDLQHLRNGLRNMPESLRSPLQITIDWGGTTVNNIKFIGSAPDKSNDKVYLFVDNVGSSAYSHIIEVVLSPAGVASGVNIFEDRNGVLNFYSNYPIYNARVFNGHIYWTDNNKQPMFVNIARAKEFMAHNLNEETVDVAQWRLFTTYSTDDLCIYGSYIYRSLQNLNEGKIPSDEPTWWDEVTRIYDTYIPTLRIEDLLFIATPPTDSPLIKYETNSALLTNNLRGNLYQFAYRWIYVDYRKSVFSPASKVEVPEGDEKADGKANDDISTNNKLRVQVKTGSSTVWAVEVIFRSRKDLSTWYRLTYFEKYTYGGDVIYNSYRWLELDFYDDVAPFAIADTEVYKPFHYVPQKARFLEIIEGNNMVFSDCLEGYPPITPFVAVTKFLVDLGSLTSRINFNVCMRKIWTRAIWCMTLPYAPYTGSRYYVRTYENLNGEKVAYYDYVSGPYPETVINGLTAAMNVQGMRNEVCTRGDIFDPTPYNLCFYYLARSEYGPSFESMYDNAEWELEGWIVQPGSYIPKHRNMKEGSTHGVGLTYYDGQRRAGPIVASDEMRFYLDYYQDDSGSGFLINSKRWNIRLTLNHLPPSWAEYYQIAYTGNLSMSYWIQAQLDLFDNSSETEYITININGWIDYVKSIWPNFNLGRYTFQSGDRMRIVGEITSAGVWEEWTYPFVDIEILGEDLDDADKLRIPYFPNHDQVAQGGNKAIIEIYRPKDTYSEDVYYELGDHKYPIKDSVNGRIHGGDTDQVLTGGGENLTGAIIDLDYMHDSYKFERQDGSGHTFYASSQHLSDYLRPTDMYNLGFPKIEDDTIKQEQLTNRLRYGGSLQLNTENNQIADFNYDGFEDFPEKHGAINGLQEVGFVLKILQRHRLWSIYIRRTSSFNPDGTETILLTDAILGTQRPDSQEWGTQNPESVVVHERHMYFWDRSQDRIIRDSANGLQDISSYKMKNFFRDLKDTMISCRCGVNEAYDEIWFHFHQYEVSGTGGSYFTIIFNEVKNRWTFRILASMQIHRFVSIGNSLFYTFNSPNGLYHIDKGADYNQFHVVPASNQPIIEIVANPDPEAVKIFKSLLIHGSHKLWAPEVGDIYIASNDNYPDGMETRLLESKVISQEGIYFAPIMMDNNSPVAALDTTEKRIVDGRPMRGQALRLIFTRTNTTERVIVEGLRVMYVNSK